jgi:hypothetical protein
VERGLARNAVLGPGWLRNCFVVLRWHIIFLVGFKGVLVRLEGFWWSFEGFDEASRVLIKLRGFWWSFKASGALKVWIRRIEYFQDFRWNLRTSLNSFPSSKNLQSFQKAIKKL